VRPSDSGNSQLITELETPTGSRIQFLEITSGSETGVLVVELGDASTMVMDRIFAAAGEVLNASDLYTALTQSDRVPARLRQIVAPSVEGRSSGWALDVLQGAAATLLATGPQIACDNASFMSSIPGGMLPHVKKRLDTGPTIDPAIWPSYKWSDVAPVWHYWYQTWAYDTPRWRGKVCGDAGFHPDVNFFNGWYPSIPAVSFLYRVGQAWVKAAGPIGVGNAPTVIAWIYNGELGAIDWKLMIYDAYIHDEFDVLMTWQ
jgi:hypothetical protein